MNFSDYLKQSALQIESLILSYLTNLKDDVIDISPRLIPFIDVFKINCEGGKRLRGSLVRLGYEMSGGENQNEILKASASIEIFQTAILAHDDIVDQSETRRGKPTIYRQLGGNHYGISQTICLGDIGFFIASKLISESNFDNDKKIEAVNSFNQMVINTGLGEMLDIELSLLQNEHKESDVLSIHKLKTAYYTIVYPLILGAKLGGGDIILINQIDDFGTNLGIAFQIQDDILGVFGDEETLGKSVTSDIEEGKNTLLITEALKNADTNQKEILEKYYGKGKLNENDLEKIRDVFRETGALEYSQNKAFELVNKSKQVLGSMQIKSEYKELLSQMSDYIISRQR